MQEIIGFLSNLTDPEWIVLHGGLYVVMLIIFSETGLFIGFFLPGDYLLFITGLIIANSMHPFDHALLNLAFWNVLISVCAILGNFVGYWFGKKSGHFLFERKDSFFFKKSHLEQARNFYNKRGGSAIIIARFLPIVRTFAPIVAGVVLMDFKKFVKFNIIGALLWVFGLVSLGYAFGENEQVKEYLDMIIIGIFVVTTLPVIYKIIRFRS